MRIGSVPPIGQNGFRLQSQRTDQMQEGGGERKAGTTGPPTLEIAQHFVRRAACGRRRAAFCMLDDLGQVLVGKQRERS